jgi:CheY-like chemotaxis protein
MNVLLAEDDASDALLIERALKKASDRVCLQVTINGEQTISYLKGDGIYANRNAYPLPSLCLLDIRMPRIDGLEVLKWIRGQNSFQQLRVVIVTGSACPTNYQIASQNQANHFLEKSPAEDLSGALEYVLNSLPA